VNRFFCLFCLLPGSFSFVFQPAFALDLIDEKLQLHAMISMSYDYMDSDVSSTAANELTDDNLVDEDVGYGGNPSRLNIEDVIPINDGLDFFYAGSKLVVWDGSRDKLLYTRSYSAGVRGSFGSLSVGKQDTPFRTVGAQFAILRSTIAHRNALIGATTDEGNRLNRRAEKSILWTNSTDLAGGNLEWKLIYSVDSLRTSGNIDNDKRAVLGFGINHSSDRYTLDLAHEQWEQIYESRINATRTAIKRRINELEIGFLYEIIKQDMVPGAISLPTLDRNAFGVNAAYEIGNITYGIQILSAESYAGSTDTGATMYSIGAEKVFNASLSGSVGYTQTKNEANGAFQGIDGVRGDLGTLAGGAPRAVGLGLRYRF
tara:strand:+ start:177 stop:1295 length:1119 start_codon:yes stop_codon:yes gene_type:complete